MLSFLVILQGNENQPVLSFSVETFPLSLWLVEKKDKFLGGIIGPLAGVKSPQGLKWPLPIQTECLNEMHGPRFPPLLAQ